MHEGLVLDALASLPSVLTVGLALAFAFSLFAGVLFVAAERVFGHGSVERTREAPRASSETRRRAEIREYLEAIDERYAENHVVRGHRVAFFLLERNVAVTFDARTYFRFEGRERTPNAFAETTAAAGPRAVLCEHEMHGHHLGARLPFDVPAVDLHPTPATDRVIHSAYEALGLSPGAGKEQVRAAYRDRVKDAHPDHGGSEAAFTSLRDAYTTAKAHASTGSDSGTEDARNTATATAGRS